MRRRNMGNKVVKRAITWAMVLMLSFSAGLSSMATMTVYAVDNRVDDCELEKERVDSTAERFNDKETSEDPAAEAALAKADEAKSAAEDAAKTVENLQKTIDGLEVEKKVEAAGAKGTGETESTGAVKAAEDAAASAEAAAGTAAKTAAEAEAKKNEISKIAEDYNKTFENNQSAADGVTAEGLTSVKGENGASDTELDKYVEEQAKAAKEAQQEAQAKLEEALKGGAADDKVSTADGEKTVKELVGEVDQAAADAAKAADDAQAAVDQANQNVADAKVKYNAYAMMYGLPLYGEKDVTYTYDADSFAKAGITDAALQAEIQKQLVDRNAVNAGKEEIENADITALEKEIQDAKTTADTAQETAKDAVKAAEDAEKAAEKAKKLLTNEEGTGSVDKTNTAAEEAMKEKKEAGEKLEAIDDVKKALSDSSDGINQVEYDKELNAWANTTFDKYDEAKASWKFWETIKEYADIYDDAKDTRRWMDNEYNASKVQEIFNYLGITQWAVSTAQREAAMDAIIKAYRENMAEYEKQLAAINAQDAKNSAEASAKAAEDIAKTAEASKNAAQAAENVISTAQDTITAAEDTYNDAKAKLDAVKAAAKNVKTPTTLELQRLFEQIQKAEQKVKDTEESLKEAVAAKNAAENFKKWADSLITGQYTRAYAQAAADENGKKTPLTENLKNYDTSNDKVISRPTIDFVCVSKGTSSVKVPYTIYRDYVNLMYQEDYDSKPRGKGISTGSKMDVIYWEVGTDGKLSGNYFTSLDELTTGSTYFIGYTFKLENDGYHIDGLMYKYEDSKEEPTTSPSEAPSTAPSTTPSTAPTGGDGGTTGTTVTIEDQSVPLAAVPADAPAVLGARRAAQDEEPAVLGVKRGTDQAVLGKRRSPKTGDSTEVFVWAGSMAIAGAAAVVSCTKLARKKEEE